MNVGSIHHLMGRLFQLEQKSNSFPYHQKTKVECISSAKKSFLVHSLDTPWTQGEVGLVIYWKRTRKILKRCHHLKLTKKCFKSKEVDFRKKRQWMCIPMRERRHVARRTPVIHHCVQSLRRPQAIILTNIFRRRRNSRSESRSWSSTRCLEYCGKLHLSESCCSKNETRRSEGRFSDTSELHWCPETVENEHCCTSWGDHRWFLECRWVQFTVWTPRRTYVGSRQTDKEAVYYKTWQYLARRTVQLTKALRPFSGCVPLNTLSLYIVHFAPCSHWKCACHFLFVRVL